MTLGESLQSQLQWHALQVSKLTELRDKLDAAGLLDHPGNVSVKGVMEEQTREAIYARRQRDLNSYGPNPETLKRIQENDDRFIEGIKKAGHTL